MHGSNSNGACRRSSGASFVTGHVLRVILQALLSVADLALGDVPGHLHIKNIKQCKIILIQCPGSLRCHRGAPEHGPGGLGPGFAPVCRHVVVVFSVNLSRR
jgi:hypothetical protein